MKIGMVAPAYIPVPPPGYGGTEEIVSLLTEGLVERGHDVTLFASGDSKTKAKLVSFFPESLGNDGTKKSDDLLPLLHLARSFCYTGNFDIIHSHAQYLSLFFARFVKVPLVHTWHGSYYPNEVPEEKRQILSTFKDERIITISDNQRMGIPELNYIGTVYNSLKLQAYPFKAQPRGKYLLWVGRIVAKKGVVDAIAAARKSGIPLQIAAAIDPVDRPYYESEVKPLIDGDFISYTGELSHDKLADLYGDAIATLYPITWHEPFGLVMIESMACGTPVIAYNIGSVPEIVKDGETGFIIENDNLKQNSNLRGSRIMNQESGITDGNFMIKKTGVKGLAEAILSINRINRHDCRALVTRKFNVDRMVSDYERIYAEVLQKTAQNIIKYGRGDRRTVK